MRKKYEEELRKALQQKREPSLTLKAGRRGRPLLLGQIDLMVQSYLRVNKHKHFFCYTKFCFQSYKEKVIANNKKMILQW